MILGPGPINLSDPLNRESSRNRGYLARWIALPGQEGGRQFFDAAGTNHATLTNMTAAFGWGSTARPGGFGELRFDGTDDYAPPPDPAPALDIYGPMTAHAWIKLTAAKNFGSVVLAKCHPTVSSARNYILDCGSDGLSPRFAVYNTSSTEFVANSPSVLTLGNWARLVGTYDGSSVKIYVNAVLQGTASAPASIAGAVGKFAVGRLGGFNGTYFPGPLDDIGVLSGAWSYDDVRADYDEPRTGYRNTLNRVRPSVFLITGNAPASNPLTIAATFPPLSVAATLTQSNPVSVAAAFPPLAASAVLSSTNPVTVAASFPALTAAASLTQTNPVAVAASFPPLAVSAALSQGSSLAVAATFPPLTVSASLASTNPVQVAAAFPALSASAQLGQGGSLSVAATFPPLAVAAVLASANPLMVATSFPRLVAAFSLADGGTPPPAPAVRPSPRFPRVRRIGIDPGKSTVRKV